MRYFAKFLPVEGEIEIGDYGLKPAVPHIDIQEPYIEIFDKYEIEKLNNKDLPGHKYLIGSKKVKLFLCSKDIQVGDNFWWRGQLSQNTWTKEYQQDKETNVEFDNVTFKVIGEVSSDAKWVKEEDEFNEEDWKLKMFTLNKKLGHILIDDKAQIGRFNNLNIKWSIAIKCPCCGDFK